MRAATGVEPTRTMGSVLFSVGVGSEVIKNTLVYYKVTCFIANLLITFGLFSFMKSLFASYTINIEY